MKIDYSLGDNLPENLKINENFSAEKNAEGIFITFAIPKNTNAYEVRIEGIGLVAENYFGVGKKDEDDFFYPFVAPNKEYTIRVKFLKEEVEKDGWNYGHPDGDGLIGWFDVKATAGANSKGEVRLLWENVAILKADSSCNIIYFQKPTFENERLLGDDWLIEIGLMEGISWEHGDERRTKWHCAVVIPNNFDATSKNLCDLKEMSPGSEKQCEHDHDIDCLCVRPIMFYKYGGKEYKYMWDGKAYDVHYPLNADFQEININDPTQISKIYGTWKYSENWDTNYYVDDNHYIPVKVKCTKTLHIDDKNHEIQIIEIFTKKDGKAFTDEEKKYWNVGVNNDGNDYKYSVTISGDNKTITRNNNWQGENAVFIYFADVNDTNHNPTKHHLFKLFSDRSELWDITYGTDDGRYYEWTDIYKKQ